MGFILTIIIGGFAGWVASKIMHTDQQQGLGLNIVAGVLGALLFNWLIAPLLGYPAVLDRLDLAGFLFAVLGACLVILVVRFMANGTRRV